jgi:hypothetical protein
MLRVPLDQRAGHVALFDVLHDVNQPWPQSN